MLVKKGILKNRRTKTYDVFTKCITSDFTSDPTLPITMKSSDYVKECWKRYVRGCTKRSNALNGNIFETIIATELYRQEIKPFYTQSTVLFVPGVEYDIVLYDMVKHAPVVLSMKTSARERFKQADLEAVALKYVHRKSETFFVMKSSKESTNLKNKLKSGEILGISEIIEADSTDMNSMIDRLRSYYKFGEAPEEKIIRGNFVN